MHRRETDAPSPQSECTTPPKSRKKRQPLKGRRFGKLVAIERVEKRGTYWMWRCKCDCGNESVVTQTSLSNGDTQSCGCKRNRLKGRRFGKLTAIEPTGQRTTSGDALWRCECDCGHEAIIAGSNLHDNGSTNSCGCNRFRVKGKRYGKLLAIIAIDRTRGRIKWLCRCDCGNEVVIPVRNLSNRKTCGKCERGSFQRQKKHCPQGHEYTQENTYTTPSGYRLCKKCSRAGDKAHDKRAAKRNAPGKFSPAQWFARLSYHGNCCRYCQSTHDLTIDHMIPIARGGSNWPSNLVPACKRCNFKKHTKTYQEFTKQLTGGTYGRRRVTTTEGCRDGAG